MLSLSFKDSFDYDDSTIKIMIWLNDLSYVYMYCVDSLHTLMHYLKIPIFLDLKILVSHTKFQRKMVSKI